MKEEILKLFIKLSDSFGFFELRDKVDTSGVISDGDTLKFYQKLEEFFDKRKERLFTFKDITNRTLLKCYILEFRGDELIDGTPVIIINDFPLGLKGDKNPVLNLELRYRDIEERDNDLSELRLLLK